MGGECGLYVGTYAVAEQVGLHGLCMDWKDAKAPKLREKMAGSGVSNPSYLSVSSDGRFLYAVMEDMMYHGKSGGGVAAFKVEKNSLKLLNTRGTEGTLPCHLLLDEERKYLYVANYMSGSVSMFKMGEEGGMGELCDVHQHVGSGLNRERQEGPHVHFIGHTADEKGIWCVDLGLDQIKYYEIDEVHAKLVPDSTRDIRLPCGVGPRHFVLDHNNRGIMYVVCELSSEVFVLDCGQREHPILQRISTLPEGVKNSTCAGIHLSEDGKFLYVSNRGDDSIAVFAVGENQNLKLVEIVKVNGKTPRDFCLCQNLLFSANQDSHTITVLRVNPANGRLLDTGQVFPCKSPVCMIAALCENNEYDEK